MGVRNSLVATAAAGLFLAGLAGVAQAEEPAGEAKIKCEGVNACKGHGESYLLVACSISTNLCSWNKK